MENNTAQTALTDREIDVESWKIIAKGLKQATPILYILNEMQDKFGQITAENITQIADALDISKPEVLSFVTFHRQFKLIMGEAANVGRHIIRICSGAPCYAKGSQNIAAEMTKLLGVESGETTKDKRFTLEVVDCLGSCGVSPVMMVNDNIHGKLTTEMLPGILEKYQ